MSERREIRVAGGRSIVVHDMAGDAASDAFPVVWHHGTPQTGALLPPLVAGAAARNIRVISYARPSYGGSSPQPGRNVASAAHDVAAVADAAGIERFAVMGASGGGPHALACAALLPDRVTAAVTFAGIAPYTDEFDWFAGMADDGGPRAALEGGRAGRAAFAETHEFDESVFIEADWAALAGPWASLGADAVAAGSAGHDGEIDDDVAYVSPWGFDVHQIGVPVLVVQGGQDRAVPASHARWLVDAVPTAELWLRPRDGHISILNAVPIALDWLLAVAGRR